MKTPEIPGDCPFFECHAWGLVFVIPKQTSGFCLGERISLVESVHSDLRFMIAQVAIGCCKKECDRLLALSLQDLNPPGNGPWPTMDEADKWLVMQDKWMLWGKGD